jgi:hypothetical protein
MCRFELDPNMGPRYELTDDDFMSAPVENRNCFHGEPCRVFICRKEGPYIGKWCFSCHHELDGCGFWQSADMKSIKEPCHCGPNIPAKLCLVTKEGPSKGYSFLACGRRQCRFFRPLPVRPVGFYKK